MFAAPLSLGHLRYIKMLDQVMRNTGNYCATFLHIVKLFEEVKASPALVGVLRLLLTPSQECLGVPPHNGIIPPPSPLLIHINRKTGAIVN